MTKILLILFSFVICDSFCKSQKTFVRFIFERFYYTIMVLHCSGYINSSSAVIRDCYTKKLQACNGLDPYEIDRKSCEKDWNLFPRIGHGDILHYLVHSTNSTTLHQMKGFKALESYNCSTSGWVNPLSHLKIINNELKLLLGEVKRWGTGDMGPTDLSNMFRGTAGIDYPDLKTIPNTSFRCEDQEVFEGGLYADVETRCQVYHVCHDGRKDSFMCGKGTIFNQQILACDYWYSAECDNAPSFYYVNSQIGNSPNNLQDNSQYENKHISGGAGNTRQRALNMGGGNDYNRNNPQPCQCYKSSYKTPWTFPAGMMHGSDR